MFENNILISLSSSGKLLDNAACETFFSSLKTEWYNNNLTTFKEVYNVIDYIQFYNFKRIVIKHEKKHHEKHDALIKIKKLILYLTE